MEELKGGGLGAAGKALSLAKPMRSRISDNLVPPPVPEERGVLKDAAREGSAPAVNKRFDPKAVAEKTWMTLMAGGHASAEFEVKFSLADGREFALRGDKEGFGTMRMLEVFKETGERILEVYSAAVKKVEVSTDDRAMTFSSYADFLEWLDFE